jgi:regulation of enolase protein 1 (concanavalin A-like superfamily)
MLARIILSISLTATLASSENTLPNAVALPFDSIPGQLQWKNSPKTWKADQNRLTIIAGKKTDWFISPLDGKATVNAPLLLFQPAADFTLSACVRVDFRKTWDAGSLMLYLNDTIWAKLSIEIPPSQDPTIVSLVTRGVSDECNSTSLRANSVYLKVARRDQGLFFYASPDGYSWRLVRAFTLGAVQGLRAGFAAQSPGGDYATAVFSDIKYVPERISDVLKGK